MTAEEQATLDIKDELRKGSKMLPGIQKET